jgi:hypothetical protein
MQAGAAAERLYAVHVMKAAPLSFSEQRRKSNKFKQIGKLERTCKINPIG